MFNDLMLSMSDSINLNKIGFYVSDQFHYYNYKNETPSFNEQPLNILKEWEIVNSSFHEELDFDIINKYARKLEKTNLWNAIVGDRFLYFGKKCTLYQDYKPRFTYNQLNKILQMGLLNIEKHIDNISPDIMIGYNSITFGESLYFDFAKYKNIPYLNLRSLKIENHVCYGESVHKSIARIKLSYEKYISNVLVKDDQWMIKSKLFIDKMKDIDIQYEGIRKEVPNKIFPLIFKGLKNIPRLINREYVYLFKAGRKDNQCLDPFVSDFYNKIINPVRALSIDLYLSKHYIGANDLKKIKYAFFPLHSEPEVSVMFHNKSYINQIEAIRLYSHNLPSGFYLVVKDHPVSIGKRSLKYYTKILEIPNVLLAKPKMATSVIIKNAELIVTVAGSVAFESILKSTPVISLGKDHHDLLPDTMVKTVKSPDDLFYEIDYMIRNYEYNERALQCYVASAMKCSAKINLYSSLLGRPNRVKVGDKINNYEKDILKLTEYTLNTFKTLNIQ